MKIHRPFKEIKRNWLFLLIAVQPVLDALAYWTNNSSSSWAGYIRLAVMFILPAVMLYRLENKKHFLLSMAVIAALCALHFLNCFRVGYIDPVRDIKYTIGVAQMPVLAICFVYAIKDEAMRDQAVKGMETAALLSLISLVLSVITGTANCTYGIGLGVSGWVIDTNRCANSIILVTLSCFALGWCSDRKSRLIHFIVPATVCAVFISNGTKACYFGLFALFAGLACFIVFSGIVCKRRIDAFLAAVLIALSVFSAAIYPLTPRYRVELLESQAVALKDEDELVRILREKGYEPSEMTTDEKLAIPEVRQAFEEYYRKLMWHVIPEMFDRYDMETILRKYDMTTSAAKLIDVRLMKRSYASLIWNDSDALTKLFGYEVSQIHDKALDPENDYPALFWYYGYSGFGLYILFILYFVYLLVSKVLKNFKASLTGLNFTLLIALALQLGLAQLSGALMRRPNVSVYLSVILALIYYQTVRDGGGNENEA